MSGQDVDPEYPEGDPVAEATPLRAAVAYARVRGRVPEGPVLS